MNAHCHRTCALVYLPAFALLHPLWNTAATAQAKQSTGSVISGHVVFADNDRPARFATVYLKSVAPADPQQDFFTVLMDSAIVNMQQKSQNGAAPTQEDDRDLKSARAAATGFLTSVSDAMLSATVSADGDYTFTGVPAGSYFVHVKAPGYIDTLAQFSPDEIASRDPEVRKKIAAAVTIVSVGGTEQLRVDQRLDRGASITGHLRYDDGSAATGWTVRAIAKRNTETDPSTSIFGIDLSQAPVGQRQDRAVTDDTGFFRIAGLPSGKYILEARLTTASLDRAPFSPVSSSAGSFLSILGGLSGMNGLRLTVYSGSATRMHDAEEISAHAGEERPGTDIVVPMGSAHSITGVVVANKDGHAVNDGSVELIAQDHEGKDDPSLRLSAIIHTDGTFRFDYVPGPGSFTLRSLHASDSSVTSTMKLLGSVIAEHSTSHSYGRSSTTISVEDKDVTGIQLAVD